LEARAHRGRPGAPRPGAARLRGQTRGCRADGHLCPHAPADRRSSRGVGASRPGRAGRPGRCARPGPGPPRARPPPGRHPEPGSAPKPGAGEISGAPAGCPVAGGRPPPARAALERVQPFGASGGAGPRLFLAEASAYRAEARYGRALALTQTAMRLSPGEPGLHREAAELYEGLKRPREALREVETSLQLSGQPADPGTSAWMDRLRTAIDPESVRALEAPTGLASLEPPDAGSPRPGGRVHGR